HRHLGIPRSIEGREPLGREASGAPGSDDQGPDDDLAARLLGEEEEAGRGRDVEDRPVGRRVQDRRPLLRSGEPRRAEPGQGLEQADLRGGDLAHGGVGPVDRSVGPEGVELAELPGGGGGAGARLSGAGQATAAATGSPPAPSAAAARRRLPIPRKRSGFNRQTPPRNEAARPAYMRRTPMGPAVYQGPCGEPLPALVGWR